MKIENKESFVWPSILLLLLSGEILFGVSYWFCQKVRFGYVPSRRVLACVADIRWQGAWNTIIV